MEQYCCECCKDMDLPLQHLIYPEVFLNADGVEFMRVHGMLDQEFRKNGIVEFKLNDHVYKVPFIQLIFPMFKVLGDDRKFFLQHGLYEAIERNVTVKVFHRCAKLLSTGRCSIYEARPTICRDFECATKFECRTEDRSDALSPVLQIQRSKPVHA